MVSVQTEASGDCLPPKIYRMREVGVFKQVQIEYGTLEWQSGYGIHGDTVARDGVLIREAA